MPLTVVEHLVLWGPPLLLLLITFGYYLRWGKEADEPTSQRNQSTMGGED